MNILTPAAAAVDPSVVNTAYVVEGIDNKAFTVPPSDGRTQNEELRNNINININMTHPSNNHSHVIVVPPARYSPSVTNRRPRFHRRLVSFLRCLEFVLCCPFCVVYPCFVMVTFSVCFFLNHR